MDPNPMMILGGLGFEDEEHNNFWDNLLKFDGDERDVEKI